MSKSGRTRSPARSAGSASPRRLRPRPSSSASESLALSPGGRRSLLSDNTEIDAPRRKSWWKKIGKNSIDIKEVFGDYVAEDENFDIENIVQPNPGPSNHQMIKPTIDLGNMSDSSTSESLGSIHMPQRKLFVNRPTQQPNEFLNIVTRRESLRRNKTETEKTIHVPKKDLFRKSKAKENKDNAFPVSIVSMNAANNTTKKDDGTINIDTDGLKKPLFGKKHANKPAPFPVFVMSDSEDDTPQVQLRLTAFKKNPQMMTRSRRTSAGSRSSKRAHSPASSVYSETMEMETWKLLPSSTMIGDDLVMNTPAKRLRRDKTIIERDDEMENNVADCPETGKIMVDEVERNNFAQDIQIEPDNISKGNKAQPENIDREEVESVSPQNEEEENDKADNQDFNHEDVQIAQISNNDFERNYDYIGQPINEANSENAPELNDDNEEPKAAIDAKSDCGDQADTQDNCQKEIAENSQAEVNDNNDEDSELNQGEVENVNEDAMDDEVESILKSDYEESDKDNIFNNEKNDVSESAVENAGGLDDIQEVENEEESVNENSVVQSKSQEVENAEDFDDDGNENNESQDDVENVAIADDKQDDDNSEEMDKMEVSAESDNESIDHNDTAEGNNGVEENEVEDPTVNEENEVEDPSENEDHEVENHSGNEEHEVQGPSEIEDHEVEVPSENEEHEVQDPSENEDHEVEDPSENEDLSENEEHEVEDPSQNKEYEAEHSTLNDENEAEDPTLNEENEADELTLIENNEAEDPSDNEENEAELNEENYADDPTENEESEVEDPSDNEENLKEDINENKDTSDEDNHAGHLNVESHSGKASDDERTPNKSNNKSRRISPRTTNISKGGIDPARMSHIDNSNRHSAEFSKNITDEVRYSSEGSGWNSHTTAYIQRAEQTMNARKSLRTLVLDKTAKIRPSTKPNEKCNDDHNFTKPASPARFSMTNNTIENNLSVNTPDTNKTSSSNRTQTSMDRYIKKITQDNWERQQKIQEKVQNCIKANSSNFEAKYFQWSEPNQRKVHQKDQNKPKPTTVRKETMKVVIDGAIYKPPKLFKPPKAPWVNKNLYKFLDVKLKAKHRYNTRIQSERFVRLLFEIYKHCVKRSTDVRVSIKSLKKKMALLDLVTTHFDFYNFVEEYMPKDFRIRVIPDDINGLPMPRNGLFGNIIDS